MMYNNYERLTPTERVSVEEMFTVLYEFGRKKGLALSGDDRAEKLVEAIATYIMESKKT